MKKLTTYQQVKDYCSTHIGGIDIDDYTDKEFIQLQKWLTQAEHEELFENNILYNLTDEQIKQFNLNKDENIINEQSQKYLINNKEIIGKCIIQYPQFKIIKEDNKNNFYKVQK